MSSTTNDTELSQKSGGPVGCVECGRFAASRLLNDICRLVVLPDNSSTLNTTGPWKFEDAFQGSPIAVAGSLSWPLTGQAGSRIL